MTVVVFVLVVWLAGISIVLSGIGYATRVPWWEQMQLDIDDVPTSTTKTPEPQPSANGHHRRG
jgi:hypothetical protein